MGKSMKPDGVIAAQQAVDETSHGHQQRDRERNRLVTL